MLYRMQMGGIQTLLMSLHRALAPKGIQFDYLLKSSTPDYFDDEIVNLGGQVFHVPYNGNVPHSAQKTILEFYRQHNYQIAHFHFGFLRNVGPLIAAEQASIPTRILHAHTGGFQWRGLKEHLFSWQHAFNKRFALKHATDLFACSEHAAKWFGFDQQNKTTWRYFPNGINCERFAFNSDARKKMRNELGIAENDLCIGHVGRFSYPKNHSLLLRTVNLVKKTRPNVRLILAGDGELHNDIENYIFDHGLRENVLLIGERIDLPDVYSAMDVFAFPSHFEGLGIALVEAQANGLPVVASGAIPQEALICDSAIVEDQMDEDAWACAIEQAFESGRNQNQLQDIIEAGFNIDKTALLLEEFYRSHAQVDLNAKKRQ